MAEGRARLEWGQTSQVLCMLYNANRDPKKPAASPDDFNPHAPPKRPRISMKAIGAFWKAGGMRAK
jgi:cytochrome P450